MLNPQVFYLEFYLNEISCLYTFSRFERILCNHITWPDHMIIFVYTEHLFQLMQPSVFFHRLTTLQEVSSYI